MPPPMQQSPVCAPAPDLAATPGYWPNRIILRNSRPRPRRGLRLVADSLTKPELSSWAWA
jgi:hypothetical protein